MAIPTAICRLEGPRSTLIRALLMGALELCARRLGRLRRLTQATLNRWAAPSPLSRRERGCRRESGNSARKAHRRECVHPLARGGDQGTAIVVLASLGNTAAVGTDCTFARV